MSLRSDWRTRHAWKSEFLSKEPDPEPSVAPYWEKYQEVFSAPGLAVANPQDLKDFANSNVGANPGNMSVFNDAWNAMGAESAAHDVRQVVEFLLRGSVPSDVEDRLTMLITGTKSFGMQGFKEALLTKVLCIMYPDRYLTILKYTGQAGKREIARSVWGLELPDPEKVSTDHRTVDRVEQRPTARPDRRGLRHAAARSRVPVVGEGSGKDLWRCYWSRSSRPAFCRSVFLLHQFDVAVVVIAEDSGQVAQPLTGGLSVKFVVAAHAFG